MPSSQILSFGPYQLDTEKVQLWCETQPVRLTPKAFQVLCYLVERPGQLVTKDGVVSGRVGRHGGERCGADDVCSRDS